jgi:hypothetical protein
MLLSNKTLRTEFLSKISKFQLYTIMGTVRELHVDVCLSSRGRNRKNVGGFSLTYSIKRTIVGLCLSPARINEHGMSSQHADTQWPFPDKSQLWPPWSTHCTGT